MAIQVINIGTSANKGDGEPLRTAFDKINDNFSELSLKVTNLETGGVTVTTGDVKGSVFGDDSTLLVDGVNSKIPSANLSGALPAIDGSALTGITTTETDPVVGAITGIVKADGSGNISAAVAGTDYLTTVAFSDLTGKPTTVAGYGITDALTSVPAQSFASLTGKPTTIAGYGITDAFDGAFGSLSGTPTTVAGYGITDAAPIDSPQFTTKISTPRLDLSTDSFMSVGNVGSLNEENISFRTIDSTDVLHMSRQGTTLGGAGSGSNFIYHDDGTFRIGRIRPDVFNNSGKRPKLEISSKWQRNSSSKVFVPYTTGDSEIDIISDTINLNGLISSLTATSGTIGSIQFIDNNINSTDSTQLSIQTPTSFTNAGAPGVTIDGNITFEATGAITGPTVDIYGIGNGQVKIGNTGSSINPVKLGNANTDVSVEGDLTVDDEAKFQRGVQHKYSTIDSATGVTTHDCNNGQFFRHTNIQGDITVNLTNLNLNNGYSTEIVLFIEQGVSARNVIALQIAGQAQTFHVQSGQNVNSNTKDTILIKLWRTGTGSTDYIAMREIYNH